MALLAAALFGCSRSAGETGSADQRAETGGSGEITLSEAWAFDNGFSPLTLEAGNYGIMYYANNFYDTLINYDNGKILPGLAESWDISRDGLVYTFYLRKNVHFTDGAPFDAEAVKTNLEHIPANLGIYNGFYGLVTTLFEKITVVDPYTVEVRLTTPYYGALNDFCMRLPLAMVSPRAYNEDGSPSDALQTATFGTGPYMYRGETDGSTYTFVKNPDYWGEEPEVAVFHVKVISDNDARQLALRNGELDILIDSRQLAFDGIEELKDAEFGTAMYPMLRTEYLAFNVQKAPFNDAAVRRAANHAVDKALICQSILRGIAREAGSFFPPGTMYCDQNLPPYKYDLARAVKILEDAGWIDTDGDGIRENHGVPLTGELIYAVDQTSEDLMITLCAQLKEAGMDIKPIGMEVAACYSAQAGGNYDMAYTYTYGGVWDPHSTIANANPDSDTGVMNRAFTLIKDAGPLINELNGAADNKRIQEIYDYLMRQIHEQALFLPLYHPNSAVVYNTGPIRDYTFTGTYDSVGYVDVASIKLK
jgi:nickel transport system substrate-binding protein